MSLVFVVALYSIWYSFDQISRSILRNEIILESNCYRSVTGAFRLHLMDALVCSLVFIAMLVVFLRRMLNIVWCSMLLLIAYMLSHAILSLLMCDQG